MQYFMTKFTFNFYNHKREQNTNKITHFVTGSNKIAKLVKVVPKSNTQINIYNKARIKTSTYLHCLQSIYIMNKNMSLCMFYLIIFQLIECIEIRIMLEFIHVPYILLKDLFF